MKYLISTTKEIVEIKDCTELLALALYHYIHGADGVTILSPVRENQKSN